MAEGRIILNSCHKTMFVKPCVKAIIFLSFWQGFILAVLEKLDLISSIRLVLGRLEKKSSQSGSSSDARDFEWIFLGDLAAR